MLSQTTRQFTHLLPLRQSRTYFYNNTPFENIMDVYIMPFENMMEGFTINVPRPTRLFEDVTQENVEINQFISANEEHLCPICLDKIAPKPILLNVISYYNLL